MFLNTVKFRLLISVFLTVLETVLEFTLRELGLPSYLSNSSRVYGLKQLPKILCYMLCFMLYCDVMSNGIEHNNGNMAASIRYRPRP